jgi:adenosylhomocysteine nucleosidase
MRPAAICGLEAEARIARRAGLAARACGGLVQPTLAAAQSLLADGADALVSFGIAGALAPHLASGALLLPRAVIDHEGSAHRVSMDWRTRVEASLVAAGLHAETGDLLGAGAVVGSREAKETLYRASGAIAVDLESHLVARAAESAGRPFLILRAVADGAAQRLPPAALIELKPSGAPALGRVLASILGDPRQIPALLRLASDTRRALFALRSAIGAGAIASD